MTKTPPKRKTGFQPMQKETAPLDIYNHYGLAILLDIFKEKGIFDNNDMKKLIRRLNTRLRKMGYA